ALAAGQHGRHHPEAGCARRHVPARRRPGSALYLDRGVELLLFLEHADPVGDLRNRSAQPDREARPEKACGGPCHAGVAAMSGETGRSARSFALILIVHLAVILFWQLAVDALHVPKFILPSPLSALRTLA